MHVRRYLPLALLVAVSVQGPACEDAAGQCEETEEPRPRIDGCGDCYCRAGGWYSAGNACFTEVVTGDDGVGCYRNRVADVDPDTPGMQIACSVSLEGTYVEIPRCEGDVVPPGAVYCWTQPPQLSPECADFGADLDIPVADLQILSSTESVAVTLRANCQAWPESDDVPGCAPAN